MAEDDIPPTPSNDAPPTPSAPKADPWPMVLQRSRPYLNEQMITDLKPNRHITQSRDQQQAIAVFNLIWTVSDAMGFPNRTRTTALCLYHRLRLYYPAIDYNLSDVSLASLFTACKLTDTLKKSLEIQATAYNLRLSQSATTTEPVETINSDSPLLEDQHRRIIGIERQILESNSFDFRTRFHQPYILKFAKHFSLERSIAAEAWLVSIDAHKTYACLKSTPQELALASLIIASRLRGVRFGVTQLNSTTPATASSTNSPIDPLSPSPNAIINSPGGLNLLPTNTGPPIVVVYEKWQTGFADVLECCHDVLDLYTDHLGSTFVGPRFGADAFIRVRIELNREARGEGIPANNNGGGVAPTPTPTSATKTTTAVVVGGVGEANGDREGDRDRDRERDRDRDRDDRDGRDGRSERGGRGRGRGKRGDYHYGGRGDRRGGGWDRDRDRRDRDNRDRDRDRDRERDRDRDGRRGGHGGGGRESSRDGSPEEEEDLVMGESVTAGDKIRGGAKGQVLMERGVRGSVRFTLRKAREEEEWKALNEVVRRGDEWWQV